MASGNTLFILTPESSKIPGTAFATIDIIQDASTPITTFPVLDFDGGAANEHADWHVTIPDYYDGTTGFTFSYKYAMDGADGSAVELEFRVKKLADSDDLTSDLGIDTQTATVLADTPIATANDLNVTTTVAMAKADAGTPVAGDRIIIRVTRDYDHEVNADDLQLLEVLVTET